MTCYSPLRAFWSADIGASGRRKIVFDRNASWSGAPLRLPCGQCIGCRLEKARQWAVRCMHEKRMSSCSAFVTLTYRPEEVPEGGSLRRRDLVLFMKRLRRRFGAGIKFYACGEYGDQLSRPHYHLLLFHMEFPDAKPVGTAKGGQTLFSSEILRELWPMGHNWIGEVSFESCAYVARYILKKVTGALAEDYYQTITVEGQIIDREPEFTVMSRRPGIGAKWFDAYYPEAYAWDSVIMNGKESKPPRFYDLRFELLDNIRLEEVKRARRKRALLNRSDNTVDRRRIRELVELKRLQLFQGRKF
ncbi:replication initiator protein [Blackfly microvirus SF02]|uniref:Replication initiator protein n=1 Tax=Blackfly microvirus SF02 TaxID=2576452 RepID=A0A4P8PKC1_9VIRU|nr:replication initiator protein [Blackfly microvirus SF02]